MNGLTAEEVQTRLSRYGPNTLPEPTVPSLLSVFLRQFLSPLIYILLAATLMSLAMGDVQDAMFIGAVLLLNGAVGTAQEYSAGKAAAALRRLEQPRAVVIRGGMQREIDARHLVPGDLVLLEAGGRVPADLQLTEAQDLQCDESLLTGESVPVKKHVYHPGPVGTPEDRYALALAGTTIARGRGRGVVTATGISTELGKIAAAIGKQSISQPPLIIRMERFARMIALTVGVAIALLVIAGFMRGEGLRDLFMLSVGLAVSAIPEGLPVAISVALAIAMRRMAKVHVIVRKMAAVESLGSCTVIATDKTGTLTANELTVTDIRLPDDTALTWRADQDLDTCVIRTSNGDVDDARHRVRRLLRAAALSNEARLVEVPGGGREGVGDTVDIALLIAAGKGGIERQEFETQYPLLLRIPYEPDRRYAASFHGGDGRVRVFAKGALETVIAMCSVMDGGGEAVPVDSRVLNQQKDDLAARGLRVLAFAEGIVSIEPDCLPDSGKLIGMTFLGLAGMQDPVRAEVPVAIRQCHNAGIAVAMITGDDPRTASTIAEQAGLVFSSGQVVTGEDVRRAEAEGNGGLDRLTRTARIYARVEPTQKLAIVLSMARNGHFVAVTGDGVNDGPALKHAHVGVAMGRRGTEVAKESADIIVTDDNFASIVNGILEGRVAYANIRKVIFMLVSTGAAEVVLFLLAIPIGAPMPLLPIQLLWLNLVTNGIQDVALAAEKAEGDELSYPPRRPKEPILDRLMVRRIAHSALIMGVGGFAVFSWLLSHGYSLDAARNVLLLLFVLFENFQAFNSRSERHSVLRQRISGNRLLILSIIGAQAVHISAMYAPVLRATLRTAPVTFTEWCVLLLVASIILFAMELEKLWDQRGGRGFR